MTLSYSESMRVMDLKEAAAYLKVSTKTLGAMLTDGVIVGRKAGREWRTTQEAIDAYLSGVPFEMPKAEGDAE